MIVFQFLAFLFLCHSIAGDGVGRTAVNCGSSIQLYHSENKGFLLNSDVYNSASTGNQLVTLKDRSTVEPYNVMWQVTSAHQGGKRYKQSYCETGKPIKCGEVVNLLHLKTKKRLHSHVLPAALSQQGNEVTAFGHGEYEGGDENDDWKVMCAQEGNNNVGGHWTLESKVRFQHVATGFYLESNNIGGRKFSKKNCPRCPIIGELEVSASRMPSNSNLFRANEQAGAHIYKL